VRCANDANCLAVSEATDGAGAGKHVVFAVILGTGCGGGIAVDGRVHGGLNGVAGEWGHNTLPWMRPENIPVPRVIAGGTACIETWISGTGLEADYKPCNGRFSSRAPKSSREALQANLPRSPRSIDSKTGSRAVWRKSSIFLIRT